MSRSLERLQPEFREKLEQAVAKAKTAGIYMVPYETERHVNRQAELWRQSRSTSTIRAKIAELRQAGADFLADTIEQVGPQNGTWATNAIPGLSWHQWGLACDLYWDTNGPAPGGVEWNDLTGYAAFAQIARECGLTSGYFWDSRDAVHVQLPLDPKPYFSIADISKLMELRFAA